MLACSRVLCEDYDTRQLLVALRQDSPAIMRLNRTHEPFQSVPGSDLPDLLCIFICTVEACPVGVALGGRFAVYTLLTGKLIMARQGQVRRSYPRDLMCSSAFDVALFTACSSVDCAPLLLPLGV